MSYPYDINPWDDNYNVGSGSNNQQSASNTGQSTAYSTGYYESGYSNPMNHWGEPQPQQQQPQEQQQFQEDNMNQDYSEPSALSRLLRKHLPFYGPLADSLAAINLPFIDKLLQNMNRDLLISKMFYFFFYSAFGSLFPLMGVYFKQQGMNPAQVGIVTGVRPFIEIFSAPFWHSLADRFNKSKALLIFSLLSWIVFTYSLAHIRPPASACVAFNDTDYVLYTPYSDNDLRNWDPSDQEPPDSEKPGQSRRKRQALAQQGLTFGLRPELRAQEDGLVELDMDLENDFEDKPSQVDEERSVSLGFLSWARSLGAEARQEEYDEMERAHSKLARFKRAKRVESGESNADDEPDQNQASEDRVTGREANPDRNAEGQRTDDEGQEGNELNNSAGSAKTGVDRGKPAKHDKISADSTMANSKETNLNEGAGEARARVEEWPGMTVNKSKRVYKQRHKTPPTHIVGMSPITVEYAVNYNKEKHSQFVTPMFSTIVYKLDDIKEVFFLLLLLISLGEFFSAPALTLADSATLNYLGENTDLYGRQRMFGSLSWAITLLLVGMALDNSTSIADHPCGPHQRERSYTVCFIIFALLMLCALLTATQFRFNQHGSKGRGETDASGQLVAREHDGKIVTTTVGDQRANFDDSYSSTQPRSIFNTAPPVNAPPPGINQGAKEKFEFLDKWKSAVFAQRTWELPEWVKVFRQFKNTLHLTYLFITWFLGCGVGLVFTFLFWHLQDVGGTPTLFGICSVINHISEILAYFFSFTFIKRFGHTRVLSVGLGCNVIRFLYVAFLTNPYYALPFELVQGITHAACFAACCSYISHVSKPELRTSTQGVMQGLHHGIGRACGALLGGYMINAIGSRASFCIYGLLSGCVLAGFLYVRRKASLLESDEEVKVDDSEALGGYGAPQGVPSAIPSKGNRS